MKKNSAEKKEVKTVTVKILRMDAGVFDAFQFSEIGKQVVMKDKDENYIKKAFTQMKKAQEILKSYYNQ